MAVAESSWTTGLPNGLIIQDMIVYRYPRYPIGTIMATRLSTELAAFGIEALAGPANEIREHLKGADDDQIVALKLEQPDLSFQSRDQES
ncbi:MAG: hypothetical protein QM690_07880 [Sphingobium sp.]